TTHRTQTTRIEVLEYRERTTIHAFAQTQLAVKGERELFVQWDVLLVLVVGAHIAGITRHRPFRIQTLVAPRIGCQGTVPAIARPADGQWHRIAVVPKLIRIRQIRSRNVGTRLDGGLLQATAKE